MADRPSDWNGTAPAGTVVIALKNLPTNSAIMMLGFSNTNSTFGPLPFNLASFGAPGGFGRVSPDATSLLLGSNNAATWSRGIPANARLLATPLFQQALVLDPTANTFGGVVSDAIAGIVGN